MSTGGYQVTTLIALLAFLAAGCAGILVGCKLDDWIFSDDDDKV